MASGAGAVVLAVLAVGIEARSADQATPRKAESIAAPAEYTKMVSGYCAACHSGGAPRGNFSVQGLNAADIAAGRNTAAWEKILRRVSLGEMPPKGIPRPSPETIAGFVAWLDSSRTSYALAHPDPGRGTLRRLNRTEYGNAVRDLLSLDVNFSNELPADDSGYGFDNIADVLTVSPTLMDRYISVAGKVSRAATGLASRRPVVTIYQAPKDPSLKNLGVPSHNERSSDLLPIDSRGGGAFEFYAPYDAVYEFRAYLNANTNTELDRTPDNLVKLRTPLKAGRHILGMAFQKELALDESVQTVRNTTAYIVMPSGPPRTFKLNAYVDGARIGSFDVPSYQMGPRFSQVNYLRDVLQMEVEGPFEPIALGETASRKTIFSCRPYRAVTEQVCARTIATRLATRAYRRPVSAADVEPLLKIYGRAREGTDFEHGIEGMVQALLVSPQFLFLRETDPARAAPGTVHRLTDLELASRLSFFLWSSIPDDELLRVAAKNRLHRPEVMQAQVDRMLADPRGQALTQNFAAQWLYLRNLEHQRPDVVEFPQFDERLRQAMKTETELFFSSIVRDNRSVIDFLNADYTYLNERLAQHYGVPGVRGAGFRRVQLPADSKRRGLLGQASILTVTSYGNHTSVVRRGKWVLENILAAAPPAPPPNVPALKESVDGRKLSARQQMELHRANPVCAACHVMMDPVGFSLENYDAVGAWRVKDGDMPIDVTAALPDGSKFTGPDGLTGVLMSRKGQFVDAFTQRLMTYALARGVEPEDMPTVRRIARNAALDDFRIRSIIMGIVNSEQFTSRKTKAVSGPAFQALRADGRQIAKGS